MEMDSVIKQIREIAMEYKIDKLMLFGSRARGDHSPISDYDIAVFGKDLSAFDKASFYADIDEVETLKKIDIVFVQDSATDELIKNIMREGVILDEQ
jgi:predicted nucleotidyltransferase